MLSVVGKGRADRQKAEADWAWDVEIQDRSSLLMALVVHGPHQPLVGTSY